MNISTQRQATDVEPNSTQPQAFVVRRCLTATCNGCHSGFPDQPIGHYGTVADMLGAIASSAWTLSSAGLRCPQCASPAQRDDTAPVDIAAIAQSPSWLSEVCCTLICCTHCHFPLENHHGPAHFPSRNAAATAALSRGWMFAAHQVWCVRCAARVGAAHTTGHVTATA